MKDILKAGVLGAGTMGSRIAAHLANTGIPVALLDLPGAAEAALESLKNSKPPALFDSSLAGMIGCGDFENDLDSLVDCDWVIEAVVEKREVKRTLLARAAPHLKPAAIVTTNTSGLSVADLGTSLPEPVRPYWFGAHFFNPPRYMRLLEIVPAPQTDPAAIAAITEFADIRLGKEIVIARDTPNFIANRIGIFSMLEAMRLMQDLKLTIEEVDALTGPVIGWPRSATFRLADLIGLDVIAEIVANFPDRQTLPPFVQEMLVRGCLGDKSGQGFYKKEGDQRMALDWKTLEYRPAAKASLPALDAVQKIGRLPERIRHLQQSDILFYRRFLKAIWTYAADHLSEIAPDAASVDRAMCAGFNWELGPFELAAAAGAGTHYTKKPVTRPVICGNASVSLVDLGDGVACLSLHPKDDILTAEAAELIMGVLRDPADFEAFVISCDGANFLTGASVPPEVLQQMNAAIKFCVKPVVAAPAGACRGAGAELVMHAARRQPHAELYMGLDQIRSGLLPAGGGCKELALRGPKTLLRYFGAIVTGIISGSALQARALLGFLRSADHATMNRARLLTDAKALALSLVRAGYKPPQPRTDFPAPGRAAMAELRTHARTLHLAGHDLTVADKVAYVLCGGDVAPGAPISEQHLLDLEREAFHALSGA